MLFGLTLHGWARLIERVAEQAAVEIPKMDLTLTTLLAGIDVPLQSIVRKFKNSKERAAVQSLIQEFQRTGQVTENLPTKSRWSAKSANPICCCLPRAIHHLNRLQIWQSYRTRGWRLKKFQPSRCRSQDNQSCCDSSGQRHRRITRPIAVCRSQRNQVDEQEWH